MLYEYGFFNFNFQIVYGSQRLQDQCRVPEGSSPRTPADNTLQDPRPSLRAGTRRGHDVGDAGAALFGQAHFAHALLDSAVNVFLHRQACEGRCGSFPVTLQHGQHQREVALPPQEAAGF